VCDLFDCLRIIEADPEILLVRIKNRMEPAYNAQTSGGYRDVSLNLRIISALASSFAVDAHVCEVQLVLRPFAEVKVSLSFCKLTYLLMGSVWNGRVNPLWASLAWISSCLILVSSCILLLCFLVYRVH
jgi:hypothetical protein